MAVRHSKRRSARSGASLLLLAAAMLVGPVFASACARPEAAAPLAYTFESPEQLAAAVVEGLEQRDVDRLANLALTEPEFKAHVWPQLPASRPERNVSFGFVWGQLHQKSRAYLSAIVAKYAGEELEVLDVRFLGDTTDYGTFSVSRKAEVLVRDSAGEQRRLRLFGSVLRQGDRYKLFSYVVD
jgi:hypothetical protein